MRFKSKAYLKAMYDKEVAIISAKNIPLGALSCESTKDFKIFFDVLSRNTVFTSAMIIPKSICGGQLVTDYEAKLVKEYESNGLEFLCVMSGGDSIDLNIEVAHEYGIPVREVFRVQGDCIGYDTKNDLWNSRWLMFRYRDWQALKEAITEILSAIAPAQLALDRVMRELMELMELMGGGEHEML